MTGVGAEAAAGAQDVLRRVARRRRVAVERKDSSAIADPGRLHQAPPRLAPRPAIVPGERRWRGIGIRLVSPGTRGEADRLGSTWSPPRRSGRCPEARGDGTRCADQIGPPTTKPASSLRSVAST